MRLEEALLLGALELAELADVEVFVLELAALLLDDERELKLSGFWLSALSSPFPPPPQAASMKARSVARACRIGEWWACRMAVSRRKWAGVSVKPTDYCWAWRSAGRASSASHGQRRVASDPRLASRCWLTVLR